MASIKNVNDLYKELIGIKAPWEVVAVRIDRENKSITVRIEHDPDKILNCPVCGQSSKRHDHRVKTLRDLDSCHYETFLELNVPRVRCSTHGVKQIQVPFAGKFIRSTGRLDRTVIDKLESGKSVSDAAKKSKMTWDIANRIKQRAVETP